MATAFADLHRAGWAHSIEVWNADTLVGGMYGLAIGRAFFGESMFSRESNTSKVAMLAACNRLRANDFLLLDCQVVSPHLLSLGAVTLPRREFRVLLDAACAPGEPFSDWPKTPVAARSLAEE